MPDFPHLVDIVRKISSEVTVDEKSSPKAILIAAQDLIKVCTELHQDPETYFDMLSCVTGIDNGVQANTMEVVYNLYSIPFNTHLMLKVVLPRENPVIDSVISIWRTADWHERECYDLFGIHFIGHPNLRRILCPEDWVGHPLRKDYEMPLEYHGIRGR